MIEVKDKKKCTGCGACVNACPRRVITLEEDIEGFIYPQVDVDRCIDCHVCEKICPMLKDRATICCGIEGYPQFYAGQLLDKKDLSLVSSGGAFWAFSQTIIKKGGIVYGAVQENVDEVSHFRAEDMEGIKRIRRSKYLQSDTGYTMAQVRDDIRKGHVVLYSGTGCQIAGLKSFLGGDFENLITCDVVCHGVPSTKVWKTYRKEKEEREGKTMEDLVFRDKSFGWRNNHYKITYSDGSVEKSPSPTQMFHSGYLRGFFNRPSCGCCKWSHLPRVSDVTLADYWRYNGRFNTSGENSGVSLICVNSNRGLSLLDEASQYLDIEETSSQLALESCRHLKEHPFENPQRESFFRFFNDRGYYAAAEKFIVVTPFRRRILKMKTIVKRLVLRKSYEK